MKLSTIRSIDYWVGVPLCFVMDIAAFLFSLFASAKKEIRKVLFIELSEAGSMIIAYSAIKRLRESRPEADLYFLTFQRHANGLKLLNMIDDAHIITIRDDHFSNFIFDVLSAIVRIWKTGIDTTIDMELYSRATAILSLLTLAARRVGFYAYTNEGLYRGRYMHNYKVAYNAYKHMSLNFMALIEALLHDETDIPLLKRNLPENMITPLKLIPGEQEVNNATEIIRQAYPDYRHGDKIVLMNPNAGELPIRAWDLKRFTETARRVLERDDRVLIAIIGLPDAKPDAEYMKREIDDPRIIDLVGKTKSLKDVVDLCHVAQVLVTNDSGPAQYASLTDINVMVFFGPETPSLYKPLGYKIFPLYSGFSCSPCLTAANHRDTVCDDNKCLQAITVEEVTRLCIDLI